MLRDQQPAATRTESPARLRSVVGMLSVRCHKSLRLLTPSASRPLRQAARSRFHDQIFQTMSTTTTSVDTTMPLIFILLDRPHSPIASVPPRRRTLPGMRVCRPRLETPCGVAVSPSGANEACLRQSKRVIVPFGPRHRGTAFP